MRKKIVKCFIDPFFISSWARFRYRDLLSKVVSTCYIFDWFFDLFSCDTTLKFLRIMLEQGKFVIFHEADYTEAHEYVNAIHSILKTDKRLCQFGSPLIKVLGFAIYTEYPILSDNYCVHRFARLYWDSSMVWNSYKLLKLAVKLGFAEKLDKLLTAFLEDTKTVFIKYPHP